MGFPARQLGGRSGLRGLGLGVAFAWWREGGEEFTTARHCVDF